MVNQLLVELVNSVLKGGTKKSRGNRSYVCPFHQQKVVSEKLEVNFDESSPKYQSWGCWVCGKNARGKSIKSLFKKLEVSDNKFQQLKPFVKNKSDLKNYPKSYQEKLEFPKEFISLPNEKSLIGRHALVYLKNRGLSLTDIKKYNIGYCESGNHNNMLIIPSYDDNGQLNYYISRTFLPNSKKFYKNPEFSKDVIPFEMFINWDLPVILCEGVFDAIAIKRNAIPLLGKEIQNALMMKLIQSKVDKIYLALDSDARKRSLDHARFFMDNGKKVYYIKLGKNDPSNIGFGQFTLLAQQTLPLNEYSLMKEKLECI